MGLPQLHAGVRVLPAGIGRRRIDFPSLHTSSFRFCPAPWIPLGVLHDGHCDAGGRSREEEIREGAMKPGRLYAPKDRVELHIHRSTLVPYRGKLPGFEPIPWTTVICITDQDDDLAGCRIIVNGTVCRMEHADKRYFTWVKQ